jgi:hypothetical protein
MMFGRYPPGGGQCCEKDTINLKGDGDYLKTRQGMISAGNIQTIFYRISYPYFLNHFVNFEYRSIIAAALITCSSGGIGAAYGRIPVNFKEISTGFLPESMIRIVVL